MEFLNNIVIAPMEAQFGNQMFKYACAKYYTEQTNKLLCLCYFEPRFDWEKGWKFDLLQNFPNLKYDILIKDEFFYKYIDSKLPNVYEDYMSVMYSEIPFMEETFVLSGYRQSPLYFTKEFVQNLFQFDEELKQSLYETYGDLKRLVSINVRRADYTIEDNIFKTPSIEWLEKCISLFDNKQQFIFTSDDIEWCKKNFPGDRFLFSKGKIHNKYSSQVTDMCLATLCGSNIISNGTFSWWGAYLNQNPERIVYYNSPWFDINIFESLGGDMNLFHREDIIPLNDNWIDIQL